MTSEEAINMVKGTIERLSVIAGGGFYPDERSELLEAFVALRGPEPDPDTRPKGCWHCRNIEAHHIEYVIAVRTKSGTPMNTPRDCPYRYCPACGRKLGKFML